MLLTWANVRNSRISRKLGFCPDDPRLLDLYNAAEERMLNHGRWKGTTVWVQFCLDTLGCVALPRNVETVERWAVNGRPANLENWYWSFIKYVGQIPRCNSCGNRGSPNGCGCGALYAVQSGTSPLNIRMQTVPGPAFVKLYPRSQTDNGKRVLLQGYDNNNEFVRRSYNGIFVDGEYVTLSTPFAVSSAQYTALTGAQKDLTNLPVLVHSYNSITQIEVKLAEWDSDEINPAYPLYQMPKSACGKCPTSGGTSCTSTVDAIVKLAHIPIRTDQDWVLLQNLVAIEHAMRGQQHYDNDRDSDGDKEMIRAISELNHELRTSTGDRTECYTDIGTIGPNRRAFSGFR